jgi:hypothetical protein
MARDEKRVLEWVGLPGMVDGEQLWFDLAARAADPAVRRPSWALAYQPVR